MNEKLKKNNNKQRVTAAKNAKNINKRKPPQTDFVIIIRYVLKILRLNFSFNIY